MTAPSPLSSRHTLAIALIVVAFFGWWGLRTPVRPLPEAGPVVLVGADGPARAVRQVFIPPVSRLSTITVMTHADAPARLIWTLDLAPETDPFRRVRRVASGAFDMAAGRVRRAMSVNPPVMTTGYEATLTLWFEGAGAGGARVETSGLDAYLGHLDQAGASRFGDLRLAVSGPNLYSDLRQRLSSAPPWLRAPLVHVAALAVFLAAITWFIADVTSARGEQG